MGRVVLTERNEWRMGVLKKMVRADDKKDQMIIPPFIHFLLLSKIFQECFEGMSSNSRQMSPWTQQFTNKHLLIRGQRSSYL